MDNNSENKKTIKDKALDFAKFIIPLFLGIFLLYFLYKDEDWNQLYQYTKEANWIWIIIPLFLGVFSEYLRALRWNMLIKASGFTASDTNVFLSVSVGYLANSLFPRAGEVARCGVLKKYEGISFTNLVGTVVTERFSDLIITGLIVLMTIFLQYEVFADILSQSDILTKISGIVFNPIFIGIVLISVSLIIVVMKKYQNGKLYEKGRESLTKMKNGAMSFLSIPNKSLFVVYSVAIFSCYYFMLYFSFWAFDFTNEVTLKQGLVVYVMGALGIIAPVQGGIGAWHFMTIQGLILYSVPEFEAKTFALVVHTAQTLAVYILWGVVAYLLLPIVNKNNKKI